MAKFDIMEAATYGYKSCWRYCVPLARLASLPVFVKLGCVAAIVFFGLEQDFLRQGLLMLPTYCAEGVLVSYIVRVFCDGDMKDFSDGFERSLSMKMRISFAKARDYYMDILAGMIVYVLIKLALSFLIGMAFAALPENFPDMPESAPADVPLSQDQTFYGFMTGTALFVFMIWAFRFLWLYIPVAMGVPLRKFLGRIRAFSISFNMLGCWLVCYIPFVFLALFLSNFLVSLFPQDNEALGDMSVLIVSSMQAVVELITIVLSSVAMAHGFKQLLKD